MTPRSRTAQRIIRAYGSKVVVECLHCHNYHHVPADDGYIEQVPCHGSDSCTAMLCSACGGADEDKCGLCGLRACSDHMKLNHNAGAGNGGVYARICDICVAKLKQPPESVVSWPPEALRAQLRQSAPNLISPPDPLPTITVPIKFTAEMDSRWNNGTLLFKVADCVVHVKDDSGREIGTVSASFGGFLEVSIDHPDGHFTTWRLDPRDAWYALTAQLAQPEPEPDGIQCSSCGKWSVDVPGDGRYWSTHDDSTGYYDSGWLCQQCAKPEPSEYYDPAYAAKLRQESDEEDCPW